MEIYLKGNYKSFVRLHVFKAQKKTNKVTLMVHGLYSESGTPYSKSRLLAKKILEKNFSHIVQFSSSRDWNIFPNDGDYMKQQEAFKGKNFNEEISDLRDTIDFILDQSTSLFNVKTKDLKFNIVANSIGGTVVSTLKDKFKYIDKIVLVGSGTKPSDSTKSILSTIPEESDIFDSTKSFRGELLFLQGSKDDVVPLDAQERLFISYKNAKTKKVVVEGANHNFSKINGKDRRKICKIYCDSIIKFLFK